MRRTVLDAPDGFADEKELLLFVSLIDQKRLRLQAAAHPLGERLDSSTPRKFSPPASNNTGKAWRSEDETCQNEIIEEIQKVSPPSLHAVEGLLTTREMAARLELSIAKVRALIRAQKLPAKKWAPSGSSKWATPPGTGPPGRRLSIRETADCLNIPPAKARQLIYSGKLPATKVGRNWVV